MESKPEQGVQGAGGYVALLIEPVWNRNRERLEPDEPPMTAF